jgi:LysM repeat protein
MSKKTMIILAVAITAVVLFSACSRTAAPSFLATPTAKTSIVISTSTPKAQPTPTGVNWFQAWGTSTAAAVQTAVANGTFTAVPPTAQPTQQAPTATPILPGTGVPTSSTPVAATSTPVPGTTPVIVVPTATPGRPATYTLHDGEFPYCLARRFDVNQNEIMTLNGFVDGQLYQAGMVVRIPQTGSYVGNRALHAHPAQYSVKVDDSFYSIACYFGDVDPTSIAAANGLSLTSPLTTGKVLNIP